MTPLQEVQEDKMQRERFEAWCKSRGHDSRIYGDGNYSDETMQLHEAWLASRQQARAEAMAVAIDIAKWFAQGDKPDEWKLKEWADRLDREAISKAHDWLAETTR